MYLGVLYGLFLLRYALRGKTNLAQTLYWFIIIGLFFFSAFRFRVGCDWSGYYFNFVAGADLIYAEALQIGEPLWWFLQIFMSQWGLPYPTVNVVTSAVFFLGIDALARRQPDRLAFLIFIFPILIINMPMSGIRQSAAIGLFCLSLTAFMDNRPFRFVFWILLGSLIHSSVLSFLLLAPLAAGRHTKRRLMLSLFLAVPGGILMLQTDATQIALERYVDTGIDASGAVFRVGFLSLSGLFFFFFLRHAWRRQYALDFGLVSVGSCMMILLVFLVPVSSVIADRIGYYLVPIQSAIFARTPFLQLGENRRLLSALPYVGLFIVFSVWTVISGHFQSCYLPYQSWLFGHEDFGSEGF